jgi:hypothetical protein
MNTSKFTVGDIVYFCTKDYEFGLSEIKTKKDEHTTTYKIGDIRMNSPYMVVVEIVLEDTPNAHLFDEKTGKKLRDKHKILCQWYSQKVAKFEERWFNESLLDKYESTVININSLSLDKAEINQKVIFKTAQLAKYEFNKTQHKIEVETADFTGTVIHEVSKVLDYLQFSPPPMAIIAIEKEEKPLFNKKTGNQNRWADTDKAKCIWYDYVSNKFSENYFYLSSLTPLTKDIENTN